jgi:biotin carboxyl carrier protein
MDAARPGAISRRVQTVRPVTGVVCPESWTMIRRRARQFLQATVVVAVAAAGALALVGPTRGQQPPAAQPSGGDAVPVTVVKAERQDLPIYADGIGTVQAWQSVQVRAQVNGYLQSINFTEGQEVKAGDVLAMIDPRPYQDALDQARAKKAGDAATLANDQLNAQRSATRRWRAHRSPRASRWTTTMRWWRSTGPTCRPTTRRSRRRSSTWSSAASPRRSTAWSGSARSISAT